MTTAVKYFLLIINNKKARNTIIGIVIGVIAAVLFLLMFTYESTHKMQHQLQKKQKKSTAFGKLTLQAVKIYPVKVNAIAHILNLL